MKCIKCGAKIPLKADKCPKCGLPLLPTDHPPELAMTGRQRAVRIALGAIGVIVVLCLLGYAIYSIYFWQRARGIQATYGEGGPLAPLVEDVVSDSYITGHAITFYGKDGDSIMLPELRLTKMFVGGTARVEFDDSRWFDYDPDETEGAIVVLTPLMISQTGGETQLPTLRLDIAVPASPIVMTAPTDDTTTVITSTAPLSFNVVYGSTVLINGQDYTDLVTRDGQISVAVTVFPQGNNTVSIVVRTPYHKESRKDIVFYREPMEINLELASDVSRSSTLNTMTVSGMTDPGAQIVVDSDYEADSLTVDQETGSFSFKAKFVTYGDNIVRFRATMDGKKDSSISFTVNYVPALAEYSRIAWRMDYEQLSRLYEQWNGRVFLCEGYVIDSFVENDVPYMVMDVGTNGQQQLLILQNLSNYGSVVASSSTKYSMYGDVSGRYYYKGSYYPMLMARYVDIVTD